MKKLAVLLALLFAFPAMANAGGYIGVGLGGAKWDTEIEAGSAELDDTDTSVKLFGGFQANDNFGIELGFVNLGEASLKGGRYDTFYMNGDQYYFRYGGSISIEAKTKYIAGVLRFPAKKVAPFVSLGLHAWDADLKATMTRLGTATSSDDGTDIMFRTGVEFMVAPEFSIVAEYSHYVMDDEDELLNYIGVLGASAMLRF